MMFVFGDAVRDRLFGLSLAGLFLAFWVLAWALCRVTARLRRRQQSAFEEWARKVKSLDRRS